MRVLARWLTRRKSALLLVGEAKATTSGLVPHVPTQRTLLTSPICLCELQACLFRLHSSGGASLLAAASPQHSKDAGQKAAAGECNEHVAAGQRAATLYFLGTHVRQPAAAWQAMRCLAGWCTVADGAALHHLQESNPSLYGLPASNKCSLATHAPAACCRGHIWSQVSTRQCSQRWLRSIPGTST